MNLACQPLSLAVALAIVAGVRDSAAQNVHHVGANGHPTIAAAVAAAQNGDIVLIQPGVWPAPFQITDKSLTLRAAAPGAIVTVSAPSGCALGAGHQVIFTGLDIRLGVPAPNAELLCAGGTVWFLSCRFDVTLHCMRTNAVLRDCQSTGDALFEDCHVSLASCRFVKSAGVRPPVRCVTGRTLQAADCLFDGSTSSLPTVGLALAGQPGVGLVDCTVRGGDGCAAITGAGGPIRTHRCTLLPGSAQLPAIQNGSELPGPLLGASTAPGEVATGQNLRIWFNTEPNDTILVFAGFTIGTPVTFAGIEQPVFGLAPVEFVAALTANHTGLATLTLPVPNHPAFRHRHVCFVGADVTQVPIQLSPVMPFVIR